MCRNPQTRSNAVNRNENRCQMTGRTVPPVDINPSIYEEDNAATFSTSAEKQALSKRFNWLSAGEPELIRVSSSSSLSTDSSSSSSIESSKIRRTIFDAYWSRTQSKQKCCCRTKHCGNLESNHFSDSCSHVHSHLTSCGTTAHNQQGKIAHDYQLHDRLLVRAYPSQTQPKRRNIFGLPLLSTTHSATEGSKVESFCTKFPPASVFVLQGCNIETPRTKFPSKQLISCFRRKSDDSCPCPGVKPRKKKLQRTVSFHPEVKVMEFEPDGFEVDEIDHVPTNEDWLKLFA